MPAEPASEPVMTHAPACSDAGKRDEQDGGADPEHGNDTKRHAYPQRRARRHRRDRGKGAERGRIQESEQKEREHEGSDTRVRAGETTDDGDTDNVVEAARKRRTGYRGSTEGGRQGGRLRPLVLAEEPLPAECLERVREQKEGDGDSHLKARVTAVPEKGKANKALIARLSKALGIPKSSIELIAGDTSRKKILRIEGDPEDLVERLEMLLKP